MFRVEPVYENTSFITDTILLLVRYGEIIFSENENPAAVFLDGLRSGMTKAIAAIKDNEVIGIVVFYDFKYLSKEKFVCYMYGAAKRGVAKFLELGFVEVFNSLKSQGCLAVRIETKKYNLPMRFMVRRLGFKKAGSFICGNISNEKISENIIYEKIL